MASSRRGILEDDNHRRPRPRDARAPEATAREPRWPGSTCRCRRASSTASSAERRRQDDDDAAADRADPPRRRHDRDAGPAVRPGRPAPPVRGRGADRIAVASIRTCRRARTCARSRPPARRRRSARIEELLEIVGLRERARDKVQTYSLGMKQRLGIAAALLSDPRLLLLDEPANGLDPAGIVAMRETLKHLAADGQDRVRLEPHPRRGPAARRRPRDHRRRPARPRGPDRAAARGRGRRPRPRRARRGRGGDARSSTGSRRATHVRRPTATTAGCRSRSRRTGRPRSTARSPTAGHLRLRARDRQRPRVAVPRADRRRATRQPRGHVLRRRRRAAAAARAPAPRPTRPGAGGAS